MLDLFEDPLLNTSVFQHLEVVEYVLGNQSMVLKSLVSEGNSHAELSVGMVLIFASS